MLLRGSLGLTQPVRIQFDGEGVWVTFGKLSGPLHPPVVHYEAPAAEVVPEQMEEFVRWVSRPFTDYADPLVSAAIRAGTSHVLFESIHPFEDGNGRIGRSIMVK